MVDRQPHSPIVASGTHQTHQHTMLVVSLLMFVDVNVYTRLQQNLLVRLMSTTEAWPWC